jgi:putative oxidoreductase
MRLRHAEDSAKLLLRLTVGILLLFHAYGFLQGDPGIPNAVEAWGLPAFFTYIGVGLEVAGACLVILGVQAQLGASAIVVFMLAGILMYHVAPVQGLRGSGNHLFMLGKNPAGTHVDKYFLESQAFYLFGSLVIVLLGAGRYSVLRDGLRTSGQPNSDSAPQATTP